MTLGPICGRKLFLPSQHLWLRATGLNSGSSSMGTTSQRNGGTDRGKLSWLVDIGLSLRGLGDIGDVSGVRCVRPVSSKQEGSISSGKDDGIGRNGWVAKAGDEVLAIDWDAHKITAADELYHTVWETFSETTYIKAPVSGDIVAIIQPGEEETLDEDTVLVRMMASLKRCNRVWNNYLKSRTTRRL